MSVNTQQQQQQPDERSIYLGYGVLVRTLKENIDVRPITRVVRDADDVSVYQPADRTLSYTPVIPVSVDDKNGTIRFNTSDGSSYLVRDLRESDGQWLSRFRTSIPVDAIKGRIDLLEESAKMAAVANFVNVPEETLIAYAPEDSAYVVGLVYSNGLGSWIRIGGDWVLLGATDTTFQNMYALNIDSEKADEYISLFDSNYITVSDTEGYESTEDNDAIPQSVEQTE